MPSLGTAAPPTRSFTMSVMSILSPGHRGPLMWCSISTTRSWTLNVESAELNEIADVDSDYMRLDGSTTYPQRMAYGFYGDVSPDGSHIVYSTCEYPLPGSVGGYGYELGITGVDGTGKRRLTDNTHFRALPRMVTGRLEGRIPEERRLARLSGWGAVVHHDSGHRLGITVGWSGAESGRLRGRHRHLSGYRSCRDDAACVVS